VGMGDAVTFGPYELLKVVGGEDAGRIVSILAGELIRR